MSKKILLGITGSIASYKTPYLIRELKERGCEVRCVLTQRAREFVTVTTLGALADRVYDDHEHRMEHIVSARWADLILIAPATANFMAKLAHGFADDLLSSLCLAAIVPIFLAPAMNQGMWLNAITQKNVSRLKASGFHFLGPEEGIQACGEEGLGRLMDPKNLAQKLLFFNAEKSLQNVRVLITAGPTHELLDPIRYLTNASSGKMGYALAEAAFSSGAEVTLISGPVDLKPLNGIKFTKVVNATQMYEAVLSEIEHTDIFISAAAVSDYYLKKPATQKIKKDKSTLTLTLYRTVDILKSISQRSTKPFLVGFAAETENVLANAHQKRIQKKLDVMVVNDVSQSDIGFKSDDNAVTIITDRQVLPLNKAPKGIIAQQLMQIIQEAFHSRLVRA